MIPAQFPGLGWVGFDLAEVMDSVGEWAELDWVVYDTYGGAKASWLPGDPSLDELTEAPARLPVRWEQMRVLTPGWRRGRRTNDTHANLVEGMVTTAGSVARRRRPPGTAPVSFEACQSIRHPDGHRSASACRRVRLALIGVRGSRRA
jgi:hypothetical protein